MNKTCYVGRACGQNQPLLFTKCSYLTSCCLGFPAPIRCDSRICLSAARFALSPPELSLVNFQFVYPFTCC